MLLANIQGQYKGRFDGDDTTAVRRVSTAPCESSARPNDSLGRLAGGYDPNLCVYILNRWTNSRKCIMLRTRLSMQKVPCKHHQRSSRFICAAGPCAGVTSRTKGVLGRPSGPL